jgi:SAM-dependent methyltransferase
MTNFYTSISPWYDQIFPYSPDQKDFVISFGDNHHLSVVDIGCGTGSLIRSLAKVYRKTAGLDPDAAMLSAARAKAHVAPVSTWFIQAGMLELVRELGNHTTDRLICFGNTLPHLKDEAEVTEFTRQAAQVLKPGGLLLLQVINYDRIIDQKLGGLPSIENDELKFDRIYGYEEGAAHVKFTTRLTLKKTRFVIENEVPLLAIRPGRLRSMLADAGFVHVEEFGNFRREMFNDQSQPYIVKAAI